MKNISILLSFFISLSFANAQFPMKKLSRAITNNTEDEIAPFISMDGNTLIYTRKRSMDEIWKVQISKKVNGTWQRASELKILNTMPKLRLLGSYGINTEANKILFVSKRRGGLGGFDLWITKLKNGNWSEPANLARPINSNQEEVNPIFSLDGRYIYFVRRAPGQENGEIMKARKKGDNYSTPVKLDLGGKFFCARIAPDNKTMYLSKVVNNETELYISRKTDGTWSKAIKVNGYTKTNDKYFALSTSSTNLLVSAKKDQTYDLFYKKLSDEYKSIPVTKVSYDVPVAFKTEVKEGDYNSFKKASGKYYPNDANYLFKIKTQDYFDAFVKLDLNGAKSGKEKITPELIKKTAIHKLSLFVNNTTELEKEKLALELQAISSSTSSNTHELVIYQSDISESTTPSDIFTKDISYMKEVELIAIEDKITIDTLGVNEDNLPIIKIDTTQVEVKKTVEKEFNLYSNDKTEDWKQHVDDILRSNNITNLKVLILSESNKGEINETGLFVRPK